MPAPSQGPYDNFGSDGAFPAGPNAWNGEPNTITPPVGFITRGFMAGEKLVVEYLNFFLQNLYLWVTWLRDSKLDGPGSATTDNTVARWDGITGKLLQGSTVVISDGGAVSGVSTLSMSGDLFTDGEVRYGTPKNRYKIISGLDFVAAGAVLNLAVEAGLGGNVVAGVNGTTVGGLWAARIRLPQGTVLKSVDFATLLSGGTTAVTLSVVRVRRNWATGAIDGANSTTIASITGALSGANTISGLSEAINNELYEYHLEVEYDGDYTVYQARLNYDEYGQRAG